MTLPSDAYAQNTTTTTHEQRSVTTPEWSPITSDNAQNKSVINENTTVSLTLLTNAHAHDSPTGVNITTPIPISKNDVTNFLEHFNVTTSLSAEYLNITYSSAEYLNTTTTNAELFNVEAKTALSPLGGNKWSSTFNKTQIVTTTSEPKPKTALILN